MTFIDGKVEMIVLYVKYSVLSPSRIKLQSENKCLTVSIKL